MSVVRFATVCDCCGARSEEYTSWPTCDLCGEDVCPKCSINPSEDERNLATCCRCLALTTPCRCQVLTALEELVRQIDLSGATDNHGHELKNLKALVDAKTVISKARSTQ